MPGFLLLSNRNPGLLSNMNPSTCLDSYCYQIGADYNVSSRRACAMQQHHSDAQRRHSGCCTALPQVSHRPERQDQGSKGPSWCSQEPPGLYDITEPCCTYDAGATTNHCGHTHSDIHTLTIVSRTHTFHCH